VSEKVAQSGQIRHFLKTFYAVPEALPANDLGFKGSVICKDYWTTSLFTLSDNCAWKDCPGYSWIQCFSRLSFGKPQMSNIHNQLNYHRLANLSIKFVHELRGMCHDSFIHRCYWHTYSSKTHWQSRPRNSSC